MTQEDFKYHRVNNFLNTTEINLLKDYCKLQHINNKTNFDVLQNNNGDTCFYKDLLMQVILNNKKNIVEKVLKIDLHPTYTFWRCYTYGAILKEHTDRPSCEFSVTVLIDSDKTDWPIYMEDTPISLNVGDAVVYKGTNVRHRREAFEGDYCMQVFLHYVNQKGPHANHRGDLINENNSR
tara:strand:+ start:2718 stop:3257 length:540 start_codon:yes stop_codon:yes gene_type:complete